MVSTFLASNEVNGTQTQQILDCRRTRRCHCPRPCVSQVSGAFPSIPWQVSWRFAVGAHGFLGLGFLHASGVNQTHCNSCLRNVLPRRVLTTLSSGVAQLNSQHYSGPPRPWLNVFVAGYLGVCRWCLRWSVYRCVSSWHLCFRCRQAPPLSCNRTLCDHPVLRALNNTHHRQTNTKRGSGPPTTPPHILERMKKNGNIPVFFMLLARRAG